MVSGGSIVVIPEDPVARWVGRPGHSQVAAIVSLDFVGMAMAHMGLSPEAASQYADDYNDLCGPLLRDYGNSATPLGDAQPFEYSEVLPDDDAEQIAGCRITACPDRGLQALPGTMSQLRQSGPD